MAGHSKWAKVKHFKGAIDAKRARIFAKLSKEITIAAKLAGGDPAMNPRLRMALLKCRGANMPMDNIERAIKRGTGGGESANYEDLTYEAFGPHGVALLVELSTDNRNRTAAEIRSLLTKNGGTIATAGSVSRLVKNSLKALGLPGGPPKSPFLLADDATIERMRKHFKSLNIPELQTLPAMQRP